jgi:hypothetical protein
MPMPTPTAETRKGSPPAAEPAGGGQQAEPATGGEQGGQRRGRPDRQVQDLTAIGLQQDVLHREPRGAEPDRHEAPACGALPGIVAPGGAEIPPGRGLGPVRIAGLLLPQGDPVQHDGDERRALDHLDQPHGGEVGQEQPEQQGARHHAEQQGNAEQRHHLRPGMRRGEVGGEREADGLGGVQPGPDQQKCQRRGRVPDPERAGGVARQDQQGERHDRQPAELKQRAEPDIRYPPPAEHRAVRVRPEPDQGPQRREDQGQGQHHGDDPGRDAELDDHHPVERTDQQHRRHADGDLEQSQPQKPPHRQLDGRGIREGQDRRAEAHQDAGELL